MPTGPHVRARSSADFLRYLDRIEPELHDLIREQWSDDGYEMLMSAAPTAWIPVSVSRAISDTILAHRGDDHLVDLYRRYIAEELIRGRFFRSLVEGTVRLFGLSPSRFLQGMARSWSQVYFGFGRLELDIHGERARMALVDIPPEVLSARGYLHSLRGATLGVLNRAGATGQVGIDIIDAESRVEYDVQWTMNASK